jgi:GntR family transcriptional regulator/MocR family aminotransferase
MDLSFLKQTDGRHAGSRALSNAIAAAIDEGRLVIGDRMPSTRDLSLYLSIARATVVAAYDELIASGYLNAERGSGTFVAGGKAKQAGKVVSPAVAASLDRFEKFDWNSLGSDNTERLRALPEQLQVLGDWDPLNHGASPPDLLPLRQWRKVIINQFIEESSAMPHHEIDLLGYPPLRESIAVFLRRTQGIVCDPEQIAIFSSNQSALNHLFSLLVAPGDVAVCEEPCYGGVREQFRLKGARVETVAVDEAGIIPEHLPQGESARFLYLTPAHQDPTGATLSGPRREKVLQWAYKNNACIIEDAWDTDFHYAGAPAPPLFSLDKRECVVYLYTFWKTLFPLVATAFLVLPKGLVPLFRKAKYMFDVPIPLIEHMALAELISEGELERHIRKIWKVLRKRRQSFIHEMTVRFGTSVIFLAEGAGLHLVARFSDKWSLETILASAKTAGIPLTSTTECYDGTPAINEFMIYFAGIPEEETVARVESFNRSMTVEAG